MSMASLVSVKRNGRTEIDMTQRGMAAIAGASLLLSACEREPDREKDLTRSPLVNASVAINDVFHPIARCEPLASSYRPPVARYRFHYRRMNGSELVREITSVDTNTISVSLKIVSGPAGQKLQRERPVIQRRSIVGIFPVTTTGGKWTGTRL